jgi:thioesterase domain-containing protein
MKVIAYISGPMTGMQELNFPAFHRAAASLRASGYTVVNPAELDALDTQELTWEQYMARDIKALVDCTHIAMLPGWVNSRGAKLEKLIAEALGLRVIYLTTEA